MIAAKRKPFFLVKLSLTIAWLLALTPIGHAESRFIRELVSSGFVDALYKNR